MESTSGQEDFYNSFTDSHYVRIFWGLAGLYTRVLREEIFRCFAEQFLPYALVRQSNMIFDEPLMEGCEPYRLAMNHDRERVLDEKASGKSIRTV